MLGNAAGERREGLLGADGCASATTSTAGERGLNQLAETNRLAAQTEQVGDGEGRERGALQGGSATRELRLAGKAD